MALNVETISPLERRITIAQMFLQACRVIEIDGAHLYSRALKPLAVLQFLRRSNQAPDGMASIEQTRHQPAADITRYSGYCDALVHLWDGDNKLDALNGLRIEMNYLWVK